MNTRAPQTPSPSQTKPVASRRPVQRQRAPLNRWHRVIGITAAIALGYLAVTGLPLVFSTSLELSRNHVSNTWVLDRYGLQAPDDAKASTGLVHLGELLFDDVGMLAPLPGFSGVLEHRGMIVAAGRDQLLLLDAATRRVLDTVPVAPNIKRIGRLDDRIVVATSDAVLISDSSIVTFTPVTETSAGAAMMQSTQDVQWAIVTTLTGDAAADARQRFRAQMLTLERLFQDLHSGRFFGPVGISIVSLSALALIALAATGIVMWWRSR